MKIDTTPQRIYNLRKAIEYQKAEISEASGLRKITLESELREMKEELFALELS